jgi:VIT1/CCC1 family predicted Fe2+/Mn2+ transporter
MTSLSSLTVAFAVSPSLSNFVSSLVAGAVVLFIIGAAVAIISTNDRVTRS